MRAISFFRVLVYLCAIPVPPVPPPTINNLYLLKLSDAELELNLIGSLKIVGISFIFNKDNLTFIK